MKGSKSVGIKQIAELANVSIGTVDRVLNERPGVADNTRKKVQEIVKDTGYKKNQLASRLKLAAKKKLKIAVLIPEIPNGWSYWNLPQVGIQKAVQELTEQGVSTHTFFFSLKYPHSQIDKWQIIKSSSYDALVTVPVSAPCSEEILKESHIPVVFLDSEIRLNRPGNFIRQNSYKAGRVAARLLDGLVGDTGRFIVLHILQAAGTFTNNQRREDGFRDYFYEMGQDGPRDIISIEYPEDAGNLQEVLLPLLSSNRPAGIFVTNSRSFLVAEALEKYAESALFMVGFDLNYKNVHYLNAGKINFLINQNPEYQGYSAIKGLYKFLTEQNPSELNRDIPVEIVIKENVEFYLNG